MAMLGEKIGKLGFGMMRLPMRNGQIDIEQTAQMVDLFLEHGFSYFDTAYGYNNGKSEEAIRETLVERHPRERFQLATKLPAWAGPKTAGEAQEMFWTSLRRTGVEFFDYYLLHNLGGQGNSRTEAFNRFGIWDFLREQREAGRIKHLGFSSHAKADHLDEVLTTHPDMEFVQLQINYADWESEVVQARRCYEVARAHGKPVIVMEPVKGGALAMLPEQAEGILRTANPDASPASWAIRYAASLDGVLTVLSGMSSLEQMRDNLACMERFAPLTDEERATIAQVQEVLDGIPQIPCTDCQYCVKGCPEDIAIPGTFQAVNDYLIYRDLERAARSYGFATMGAGRASACIACGQCEEACPQSIAIIEELSKAAALLEA